VWQSKTAMERVLIFETEEAKLQFKEALEKATFGRVLVEEDHGWPKPALRVWGAVPSQIMAASTWAGFSPVWEG
jgi:hypothetical protein